MDGNTLLSIAGSNKQHYELSNMKCYTVVKVAN